MPYMYTQTSVKCQFEPSTRKHQRGSKVATPESNVAQRGVRLSPFLFFLIRADSSGNENRYDRNSHRNMPIRPILAEMGSGCHSFASCGLVRGKKKKEEEDEKTPKKKKKKDGRKIKVCNKRI